jgi:short-subunit dehydrogenase
LRVLKNRVAVITGAAGGIGRATATALASEGCELALSDVEGDGLAETAELARKKGVHVSTHLIDVADRKRMEAWPDEVVAEHRHVHIVINNAGVAVGSTIEDGSLENFEWIVGVNFWGTVYGCKFFIPHLRKESEAHIVNISSLFGLIGLPGVGAYCATKAAVRSLSETLLAELSDSAIGVTSVHPGGIATGIMANSRYELEQGKQEAIDSFARYGMSPDRAAGKIVRAIRNGKPRLRICRETFLADWLKRALPNTTNRLVGLGHRWGQRKQQRASET